MAIAADLVIPIGDTWRSRRWAIVIGGTVIDLTTDWRVRAQMRRGGRGGDVLHEWTGTAGVELGSAQFLVGDTETTGTTLRLHLPASTTFSPGSAVWDLEIEHPTFDNGALYRKTVLAGHVRLVGDVTRV